MVVATTRWTDFGQKVGKKNWLSVVQTGCGDGELDSNGGSDYALVEVGDTSDTSGPCGLPQGGGCVPPSTDAAIRIDVTRGDGTPDTCASGGTANLLITVPVFTTTWIETTGCPGDSTFNPASGDVAVVSFAQNLDFTTDSSTVSFSDIDADGCSLAGSGGSGGAMGTCLDYATLTAVTVATGPIGSSGIPLYDLSFITTLPTR